jgi:hypothetical protein
VVFYVDASLEIKGGKSQILWYLCQKPSFKG